MKNKWSQVTVVLRKVKSEDLWNLNQDIVKLMEKYEIMSASIKEEDSNLEISIG